jgi:hypothetical protein
LCPAAGGSDRVEGSFISNFYYRFSILLQARLPEVDGVVNDDFSACPKRMYSCRMVSVFSLHIWILLCCFDFCLLIFAFGMKATIPIAVAFQPKRAVSFD